MIISRPCFFGELRQLRHARHRAVLVHDLADHAGRRAARRCARDRPPLRCARRAPARRRFAHAAETRGRAAPDRAARSSDRSPRARCARDRPPKCPSSCRPSRRSTRKRRLDAATCSRDTSSGISSSSSRSGVIARHIRPRPCRAMKLIASGVTSRRRHRQIAFVLAILIVDDDDHVAGANGVDRVFDRRERRSRGARPLAMRMSSSMSPSSAPMRRLTGATEPASSAARRRTCRSCRTSRFTRSPDCASSERGVRPS